MTKKTTAKAKSKTASRKTGAASAATKAPAVKKAAAEKLASRKAPAKRPSAKRATPSKAGIRKAESSASGLYLGKELYKASIDGLRAQGLDQKDAVDTLRVGLREANGRPVPAQLRGVHASNESTMQLAA